MTLFVAILTTAVLGALTFLATREGHYVVRRTRIVNADPQRVFDKVRDFKTWKDWSPWLIHEPDAPLEFSDNFDQVTGYYTWDGKRVGAGKLTHEKFDVPRRIDQTIEFFRPFKSVCRVAWEFEERDGQTEVSWIMQGKMPFLFRFMTEMTKHMIGQDYDLGLALLNGELDPTAERPLIRFEGEAEFAIRDCLCLGFSGGIDEMKIAMEQGYPRLLAQVDQQQAKPQGVPLAAYYRVNIKTRHAVCDMALPVGADIDAGDFGIKPLGGGRYYKVTLQGSYDFLELAWYKAMSQVKMLKLKFDRSRPSLEVYENNPYEIENSNELLTSIYVPLK